MKLENPCRHCVERHAGCHAGCEQYAAWKAEQTAKKKQVIAEKGSMSEWLEYQKKVKRRVEQRRC